MFTLGSHVSLEQENGERKNTNRQMSRQTMNYLEMVILQKS